jgi:hypothetical protein
VLSTALRVLSGIARRPQTVLKLDVLILGSAELSPTRTRLKPRTVTITPISAWLDVEWALEHTLGSNALLAQPSATRVISVCVPSGDYTQRGLVSALHAACVNQVQNSPIGGLPFAAKVPPPPTRFVSFLQISVAYSARTHGVDGSTLAPPNTSVFTEGLASVWRADASDLLTSARRLYRRGPATESLPCSKW